MKKICYIDYLAHICIFVFLFPVLTSAQTVNYSYGLNFSTYLGGSNWDQARDVTVDSNGDIVVVGGTASIDFPTTTGPVFNNNSCSSLGSGGKSDVFVTKYSPNGNLIWSRLLGGPCYDRAYGVEVDQNNNIYITGRAGEGLNTFHSDPNKTVFQKNFGGYTSGTGLYGGQNCFVAKLNPDSSINWISYFGIGLCRDIAIDSNSNIYLPMTYWDCGTSCSPNPPEDPSWLPNAIVNAYQKTRKGGNEVGVAKIKSDGTGIYWATWFGGDNTDGEVASIRVDSLNQPVLLFNTFSNNIPTTNAFDTSLEGPSDVFLAKFNSIGSQLIFGTYLGGDSDEGISTHNLILDNQNNIYATPYTNSSNYPTTSGVIQPLRPGTSVNTNFGVTKFSPQGQLVASTYLGGSGFDNPDGVYVSQAGEVVRFGESGSFDYPTTNTAYQLSKSSDQDAIISILSPDFTSLRYSTFIGGPARDIGRAGIASINLNTLIVTGSSDGYGWPQKNPTQVSGYGGGQSDSILAVLNIINTTTPVPIPSQTPTEIPQPTATSTPFPKPGDANNDGVVNGADFIIWFNNYKTSTDQGPSKGDFNSDQLVNGADFIIWFNNYKK